MKKHCCDRMVFEISRTCRDHDDPFDCPDCLVYYSPKFDEYGFIIHDGNRSTALIQFCPWCGTALPSSKRDVWVDTLIDLGFDDPWNQEIPQEFQSDRWFRNG